MRIVYTHASLDSNIQPFSEFRRGKMEESAAKRLKAEENMDMKGNVEGREKNGARRRQAGAERGDGEPEVSERRSESQSVSDQLGLQVVSQNRQGFFL